MKAARLLLILTLFISGCKKEIDNSNCKMSELATYNANGDLFNKFSYEYDNLGRLSKISIVFPGNSTVNNITYNSGNVVAVNPATNTVSTYFLNIDGRADSATVILPPSPNQLKFYYKYTYNSDGYLISEREIFSQVNNGTTFLDTAFISYTIQNGNITGMRDSRNTEDVVYEYSDRERPSYNIAITPPENGLFSFLGKSSKNLVSALKGQSGTTYYVYSYKFDKNERLIEMSSRNVQNGQINKITYSYICN